MISYAGNGNWYKCNRDQGIMIKFWRLVSLKDELRLVHGIHLESLGVVRKTAISATGEEGEDNCPEEEMKMMTMEGKEKSLEISLSFRTTS